MTHRTWNHYSRIFRFPLLACILFLALAGRSYAYQYGVNIHINDNISGNGSSAGHVTIVISGDAGNVGTYNYPSYVPNHGTAGQTYWAQDLAGPDPNTQNGGQCPPDCCGPIKHALWYISGAADDGSWTISGAADAIGTYGHQDACGLTGCDTTYECFVTGEMYGSASTGVFPVDENKTKECDDNSGCSTCSSKGMASYWLHLMLASLHIEDTPISYNSPTGPAPDVKIVYNQREVNQPTTFTYSNLGPRWTFNWLSYITDDPNDPSAYTSLYVRGGGTEVYTGYEPYTRAYAPEKQTAAVLVRNSDGTYDRSFPDGSKEVFSLSDARSSPHKVFLTRVIDAHNNEVDLTYDNFRVSAITDALGQTTNISYVSPDPAVPDYYRIDYVTDPFGRVAHFEYQGDGGQLSKITDPEGIESEFFYGPNSFINRMHTPYGDTLFTTGENGSGNRWVEVQDPEGGRERVEYKDVTDTNTISSSEGVAPPGVFNANLNKANTFYWDKKAMAEGAGDYTYARVIHWLNSLTGNKISGIKHSEKRPRGNGLWENRVWYSYPNQVHGDTVGSTALVAQTARILDDGTTQSFQREYNSFGNVTRSIDPKNRVTSYEYAPNGIDLVAVYQRNPDGLSHDPDPNGQAADKIAEYTYLTSDPPHLPHTIKDAARQTTTYMYTSHGQIQMVQNARDETTEYTYGDGSIQNVPNGYLQSIRLNGTAAVESFTYDCSIPGYPCGPANRVRTVTSDPDNYTITTDYDNLDRPTKITYPMGTEEFRYTEFTDQGVDTGKKLLDLTQSKDRDDHWTYRHYDGNRHMDWIKDPLLRKTSFDWCNCGSLDGIVDANLNVTHFEYDLQSRVTSKTYAAETPQAQTVSYVYENTTPRLKSMTDAIGQTTNYLYDIDDNLSHVSYSNAQNPTPNITYAYDPYYNRLTSVTSSGTGVINATMNYGYYTVALDPGKLGANQLHTLGGLFPNDTVTYSYDELGRTVGQSINDVLSSVHYDSLGRMDTSDNPLGHFSRAYDDVTRRLQRLTYPNGVRADYTYFVSNTQDRRLETLRNSTGNGATTLSQFDFTYDSEGQIQSLAKSLSGSQTPLGFNYDDAKELTTVGTSNQQFDYSYDNAANRYDVKTYTASFLQTETYYTINHLNQLDSVSVNSGTAVPLHYDNNGNMTDDAAGKTYEWDAANRLVAINYTATSSRTEFAYDGLGRRVKISEYGPGVTAIIQPQGTDYTPFTTEPFVLTSGSYTLTFQGLNPTTNVFANTSLLDDVKLNGTLVPNGGFETPTVQDYQVAPAGSTWSYSGSSGIAANGGTFTAGNPPAPEGTQVGFIQNDGSLWQGALVAAGTYTLSFQAAQRSGNDTYQQLRINLRPALGPTSVKTFVWSGNTIAEERDSSGANITKRFFAEGEQRIGGSDSGNYYYTRDHLGSAREVTDATGVLKGQYDYDAWGKSVVTNGKMQVAFGFTGHYFHQASGLNLAMYRAYSPSLGRWISRDALEDAELVEGPNLYEYVANQPLRRRDPLGFQAQNPLDALGRALGGLVKADASAAASAEIEKALNDCRKIPKGTRCNPKCCVISIITKYLGGDYIWPSNGSGVVYDEPCSKVAKETRQYLIEAHSELHEAFIDWVQR